MRQCQCEPSAHNLFLRLPDRPVVVDHQIGTIQLGREGWLCRDTTLRFLTGKSITFRKA
jgi:hypothetical protein